MKTEETFRIQAARILAEILLLQRWAGGQTVDAARLYGLKHGFETTLNQEEESKLITEETQDHVEDMLEDVDQGRQSVDGPAIKHRLLGKRVDESDAGKVMRLCQLQSRFLDAIDKIIDGPGSVFGYLRERTAPESQWTGALHYMELVDMTEGVKKKLHAVLSPAVPRIGEVVTPESGSPMQVVDVEYLATKGTDSEGCKQTTLIPYVYLKIENATTAEAG
jgi:hypothetical protein